MAELKNHFLHPASQTLQTARSSMLHQEPVTNASHQSTQLLVRSLPGKELATLLQTAPYLEERQQRLPNRVADRLRHLFQRCAFAVLRALIALVSPLQAYQALFYPVACIS